MSKIPRKYQLLFLFNITIPLVIKFPTIPSMGIAHLLEAAQEDIGGRGGIASILIEMFDRLSPKIGFTDPSLNLG